MRKFVLALAALLVGMTSASAQKIGFINTEQILGEILEYQQAQNYLNKLSDKYRASIESEVAEIDKLYQTYQSQKASLTASQRSVKEQEIISREQQVKEKQKLYFGENGVMAKRSEELLSPIQSIVNDAITTVAETGGYDMIVDLAAAVGVVYKKPDLDLTQRIINLLADMRTADN